MYISTSKYIYIYIYREYTATWDFGTRLVSVWGAKAPGAPEREPQAPP